MLFISGIVGVKPDGAIPPEGVADPRWMVEVGLMAAK
jgi:hypothetical protein